ncbi:MAG: cation-translocating P-type ATPase [Anaerolineae bacterium]|nr:cation-translocating P-type ATPase [Anaerolineae bacterium]
MTSLRNLLQNPRRLREALTIGSGTLIVAALLADNLPGGSPWYNGLMAVAALVAGADIAVRAVRSLYNRHISIELLVTIAAGGALLIGEYWEAAAVTFLFVLGAYLEARTLSRTRQVLRSLLDLAPTTAIVLRDGRQEEVAPAEVTFGEIVLIKPGSKVPVDGEVIDGRSAVDESMITGEPIPAEKQPGAPVFAGTINQAGLLHVRATGTGMDTTLARIIRRVEEAQDEKAPTQRFIERFARWYTPFIIALSGLLYLLTRDVELALTILVIGCPGALVISTPVSVVAGIGRAAKSGILIKGGEHLENAGKISALALDKTGTLTAGRPRLTDVVALQPLAIAAGTASAEMDVSFPPLAPPAPGGRWTLEQGEVLRLAAIAEAGSEHPLARAILDEVESQEALPAAGNFETFTGKGIQAEYQAQIIRVGTADWLSELGIAIPLEARDSLAHLQATGKTAVLVAVDNLTIGILGIADTLRPAAPTAIRQLKAAGLRRIVMLTGDNRATAEAIAAEAGITEVHARLLPEDKLEAIRRLQREGHVVAMIGDGINDSPALAAADVGIAMGAAGTDIAIETADIALMADDLLKLPEAIRFSRATLANIHQNMLVALVTVTGLLIGVIAGEVHMAGGMLIHEASVLLVILNGMRLLRL